MRKLFMFLAAIVFSSILWGQGASTYSFSSSNGVYTPITGGTQIVSGSTSLDSWTSLAITIPSFTFAGTSYTTAYVTSNGLLNLGGSAPSTTSYDAINTSTGSGISICPFNADLDKVGSSTEIRWEMLGDTIVFQWTNFKRYNKTENFDFQVRLNTVNGSVSFVYNLNSGPANSTSYYPQVGIRSSATSFKVLKVSTGTETWANPLIGTSSADICVFNSASPAKSFVTGQTYTFSVPQPCVNPTTQAASFIFSNISSSSITGTFTNASDADGYLILRSTSASHTTLPVDGTTYAMDAVLGTDTVVQVTSQNTFTSISLKPKMQYEFVVYAMNSSCIGGPKYNVVAPLISSATTVFDEPGTLVATATGLNEIGLSATSNVTGDDIIVAWESSNTFGTPTGSYAIGDSISGGGKVIYIGPASGLTSHIGLTQSTRYFYKAWSVMGTTYSPTGKTANAKTLAPAYTLPFTESFTSTTELPNGWTNWLSSSSDTYSWTATSGGVADGCAYSGYYGDIWMISNAITVPANGSIDITFFEKNTYPGDYKKHALYYSTTGAKTLASWTPISDSIKVAPGTWSPSRRYTLFGYPGTTIYLGFFYKGANADGWYVDNVHVEQTPACPCPIDLSVPAITNNSADLNWNLGGSESEWSIEYDTVGFTQGTGTIINNITSRPYQITGLQGSKNYSFYVKANCGAGSSSTWSGPFTFKTLCDPVTLPLNESFDGVTTPALPSCWSKKIVSNGTSANATTSTTNHSAPNSVYLASSSDSKANVYLISPAVSNPIDTVRVKFWLYSSGSYSIKIGVMSNPDDTASFTQIESFTANSTWSQKTVNFNTYSGSGKYIAFRFTSTSSYQSVYVDDIQIETLPPCIEPTTLSVSNISSSSAKLNWNEAGNATSWNIEYGAQGFTQGTGTVVNNISAKPYELTGLNQSTSYSFYVQSNCSSGIVSTWAGPFTFTTYQQPLTIPTTIDFESSNGGFVLVNGTQTNQWYVGSAVANGGMNSIYISNDNGATNSYSITNSSTVHVYRDIEFPTGNQAFTLSFDWKAKGESCCDHLKVYLVDPSANPVAGTELSASNQVGLTYNNDTIWNTANIILPGSLSGTVKKLIFTWRNDGSGGIQSPVAIDNISIQTLQCPPINAISSENTTHNTATINWTSYGTETSWNIEYGVQGFTQGTGTVVNTNNRPYTITNLGASTAYQVYIQADCGSGSSSTWVGPFAFTTDCAPATVFPTMEEFATVTPSCWSQKQGFLTANSVLTSVSSGWSAKSFGNTGSSSAAINIYGTDKKNWLISPAFNFAGTNPMQVEFDVAFTAYNSSSNADTTGSDDKFVLLASIDNGATWSNANILREWNNTAAAQYRLNNIPKTGTHVIIALPAYTGNVRFALYGESTVSNADNDLYVDNFSISEVPSCQKPTNLTLVSNTYNQAVLNWNTGMNETQWNIEYGPQGFTQGTGTMVNNVTTKPYTLTGLNPTTAYSVYVQANCGTGNTSLWIGPLTFTTNVAPNLNYPFVEDFETTPNNNWTIVNGSQTNKWFIGSASAYSGQQAAYISNDNGTSNTYTLGTSSVTHIYRDFEFPANASHVYIRFNWKANGEFSSTIYDYLRVSMCNIDQTPVAGSLSNLSFITPELGDTTDWKELNLNIDTLAGKTKRLVFTWRNDGSDGDQPPASIDNIIVSLTPPIQIYNVVGGGSYCQMTIPSGVQVKLDSSQVGYNYQLFRNGNAQGNPIAGTGNALTWDNVSSGNYTVQAISGTSFIPMNGTAYVYENSAQHVTVSLLNPVTSSCQGVSVTFTANGINGGTTPSYQWIVNGANVGTNNYQYSYVPANNDTIKCIFTSSLTCNDGPATSIPHVITVSPNVTATLAITADSTTIHAGSLVTFTATATHAGSAPVYEWKVNNQGVGTNNSTFAYNPLNNDAVYCKLTSNESCVTNSPVTSNTITINATLSINENGQLGLKIYTANSQLIVLNESNGIIRDIAIMNLLGQQVFHKSVNTVNAENIALNLIPSTYVVRVTTDKGIVTQKILIH